MITLVNDTLSEPELAHLYYTALYHRFYELGAFNSHEQYPQIFVGYSGTANFFPAERMIGVGPGQTLNWSGLGTTRFRVLSHQIISNPQHRQHSGGYILSEGKRQETHVGSIYTVERVFSLSPVSCNYAVLQLVD